jgi:RNAse (barnase) inhibitor barstar
MTSQYTDATRQHTIAAGQHIDVSRQHADAVPANTLAGVTVVYVLHGTGIHTLEDFWREIGDAVNGPGGYFGTNLDAFADCLRGGHGTPDGGDFTLEWRDHQISRHSLGYPETIRQLEQRLARAHPSNKPAVDAELADARAHRGPTVFDWLVDIINTEAPGALLLR